MEASAEMHSALRQRFIDHREAREHELPLVVEPDQAIEICGRRYRVTYDPAWDAIMLHGEERWQAELDRARAAAEKAAR